MPQQSFTNRIATTNQEAARRVALRHLAAVAYFVVCKDVLSAKPTRTKPSFGRRRGPAVPRDLSPRHTPLILQPSVTPPSRESALEALPQLEAELKQNLGERFDPNRPSELLSDLAVAAGLDADGEALQLGSQALRLEANLAGKVLALRVDVLGDIAGLSLQGWPAGLTASVLYSKANDADWVSEQWEKLTADGSLGSRADVAAGIPLPSAPPSGSTSPAQFRAIPAPTSLYL